MKPGPAGKETVSLIALGKTLREEKRVVWGQSHICTTASERTKEG